MDSKLSEEANLQTRDLLEQAARGIAPADSEEQKVGDYYAAYMDEDAIEAKGLKELNSQLDQIAAISDRHALARSIAQTIRADVDPLNNTEFHTHHLFGVWVAQDFNRPIRYAPYLLQGGLGMPDRQYYLDESPRMAEIRTKYKAHIAAVFKLAGIADGKTERIFDLETKIAKAHWSRADSEDVQKANNPWKKEDFSAKAPGLEWDTFLKTAGLDSQSTFIVWQPSGIIGEAALVGSEPLDTWKEYLSYQALDDWSNFLPRAFVQEQFAFYGKILSGTPQPRERWKRAVGSSNYAMGDAVGRLYVQRYFPPDAKAKAEAMVGDLVRAFGRRIKDLTWMSPETKARALEKLETLKVGVGYPDKWRDYRAWRSRVTTRSSTPS